MDEIFEWSQSPFGSQLMNKSFFNFGIHAGNIQMPNAGRSSLGPSFQVLNGSSSTILCYAGKLGTSVLLIFGTPAKTTGKIKFTMLLPMQ